ncbi:urea ABC transporter ATP-binding protein UrtD [Cerasicoccus fimbriatus]|uniref:urea ABC transporter ATP-binding protein UrtD n=1 Tax=Cerasicoccus fimbriatus TaxID=3014554 RepID=UPI0022B498D4|nr:urea ABC transporter ATP-binding protein UrtD [Cerasicoccus sp. TK19100]
MSETEEHKDKKEFVLTVEGLNKSFDGFQVIKDLNLYIDRGELRTIIGPNGAGKSTFLDLITGRTRPDSGIIEFGPDHKTQLTKMQEYEINRLGISRKFQTPTVYSQHTVYENLMLSLNLKRSVFATLFYRESKADKERINEILETIRMTEKKNLIAGSLSHGQKQWLEIGMLLAQDPKLLLVDEPAAGMTDEETERTGELLLSLAGKHSLIVIEHDMVFVRQIATKVTVLHQGSVLREGTIDQVQADPKVVEVYLGRSAARGDEEEKAS